MTGSIYIDYDKALNTGMKLIKSNDKDSNFGLYIICAINLGLRAGDLLKLHFKDLRKDEILIKEEKTGKKRKLTINNHIKDALNYFKDAPDSYYCFRSQKSTVYSIQHINRLMKKHFKGVNISSHSLRKAFGRRVWENDNQSERSLVYLSQIFNHSSTHITRVYLGITQDEIDDIYMNL